jgi:predicted ATP-dependent protease
MSVLTSFLHIEGLIYPGADMKNLTALKSLCVSSDRLYRRLAPDQLVAPSTNEIPSIDDVMGQDRAHDALKASLKLPLLSSNVYVAGEAGSGREALVRQIVTKFASGEPVPPDWVLLNNFQESDHPFALSLPAGHGAELVKSMEEFVRSVLREIPRAFESEAYEKRKHDSLAEIHKKKRIKLEQLRESAKARQVSIEATLTGFVSMPLFDGKPVSTDEFEHLPEHVKQDIQKRAHEVQALIHATLRELRQLTEEEDITTQKLDREIAQFALGSLFDDLKEKYNTHPRLLVHFDQIQEDLLNHLQELRAPDSDESELAHILSSGEHTKPGRTNKLNRYRVNLLVDHRKTHGAPVIFERNPSYYNLFGRIEYRAAFGTMTTNLMEIKSGAVLHASGGFLVLDALELLKNFSSWESLKRVIKTGATQIENLGDQLTLMPVATLRPDAVPVRIRIILIGSRYLYHLLFHLDEDFKTLFELKAEFDTQMEWNDSNVKSLLGFISHCVKKHKLKPFDRAALARLVEHAARLCSNQTKLTTRLAEIESLAGESSTIAASENLDHVTHLAVEHAIDQKTYRSNLLEARIQEMISNGILMIDTTADKTAQVNGVAVINQSDYAFGIPTRITASVSIGRDGIQSIERESKMSGKIHSKGFLILSGYLKAKYAKSLPLALAATITFEQSYDEVEGDSASSAELYALLSALSETPIRQGIAVTGACNQHGEIQAVGGINEKIEGFFAVCKRSGLTGQQGIVIPASNIMHLMLKKEVRDAVDHGLFNVWAINNVDQGIELITGIPAGEALLDGTYPKGTIHELVHTRLEEYANRIRSFMAHDQADFGKRELKRVA